MLFVVEGASVRARWCLRSSFPVPNLSVTCIFHVGFSLSHFCKLLRTWVFCLVPPSAVRSFKQKNYDYLKKPSSLVVVLFSASLEGKKMQGSSLWASGLPFLPWLVVIFPSLSFLAYMKMSHSFLWCGLFPPFIFTNSKKSSRFPHRLFCKNVGELRGRVSCQFECLTN